MLNEPSLGYRVSPGTRLMEPAALALSESASIVAICGPMLLSSCPQISQICADGEAASGKKLCGAYYVYAQRK
jgi:hypothetical protein